MLGLSIITSGADNRENARIWAGAPTFDGVEFIHLFGRSLEQSVRNLAPGKPDAHVMGSPIVADDYLQGGDATDFIQTWTRDWESGAYIVVARAAEELEDDNFETLPMLIGTADQFADAGSALYASTETKWRQNGYYTISSEPNAEVADNPSTMDQWSLLIGEFSPSLVALANMTGTPDRGTVVPGSTARLLGHQRIGILGNTGAYRKGRCEVALAIGLSRVMEDDAERLAWKLAIQRLLSGTAISI